MPGQAPAADTNFEEEFQRLGCLGLKEFAQACKDQNHPDHRRALALLENLEIIRALRKTH